MKKDIPLYRPNLGKLIIAVAGTAFFGVGGAVILYHARQAAAIGLPMVNDKGEIISATKVYLGASAMLAAAVLYGWRAKVVYRQRQMTKR
jgi:hypothetical protein